MNNNGRMHQFDKRKQMVYLRSVMSQLLSLIMSPMDLFSSLLMSRIMDDANTEKFISYTIYWNSKQVTLLGSHSLLLDKRAHKEE